MLVCPYVYVYIQIYPYRYGYTSLTRQARVVHKQLRSFTALINCIKYDPPASLLPSVIVYVNKCLGVCVNICITVVIVSVGYDPMD